MTAEAGFDNLFGRITLSPQAQPFTNLVSGGYWGCFSWSLERPGREADQSPPSNAETKNV